MGAASSLGESLPAGHPFLFYRGCKAVEEGRYSVAELFFLQAMKAHSGHSFWLKLVDVAVSSAGKNTDTEAGEMVTRVPKTFSSSTLPTLMSIPTWIDESCTSLNSTLENALPNTQRFLELPVDDDLLYIHEYARMVSDIAMVYFVKAIDVVGDSRSCARRLGMAYAGFIALRLHTLVTALSAFLEKRRTVTESRPLRAFPATRSSLDTFRSFLLSLTKLTASGDVLNGSPKTEQGLSHEMELLVDVDEEETQLSMLMNKCTYLWVSNLLSYVFAAMQYCSDTSSVIPIEEHRAIIFMSLSCFDAIEKYDSQYASRHESWPLGLLISQFLDKQSEWTATARLGINTIVLQPSDRESLMSRRMSRRFAESFFDFDMHPFEVKGGVRKESGTFLTRSKRLSHATVPLLSPVATVDFTLRVMPHDPGNRRGRLETPLRSVPLNYMDPLFQRANAELVNRQLGQSLHLAEICGLRDMRDRRDEYTRVCFALEEMALLLVSQTVAKMQVQKSMGLKLKAALLMVDTIEFGIALYGEDSLEVKLLQRALLVSSEG